MKWVTWEDVGIDRIGSAWLIRRFVDPEAKFRFIPAGQPSLPACAEPFDIPGARLSHHRSHSTFHEIVDSYALDDPILRRLARIVDEADTIQEVTVEPAAPGPDLICRGIRRISPDDQTALEWGALVYEALYAQLAAEPGWAQRRTTWLSLSRGTWICPDTRAAASTTATSTWRAAASSLPTLPTAPSRFSTG